MSLMPFKKTPDFSFWNINNCTYKTAEFTEDAWLHKLVH